MCVPWVLFTIVPRSSIRQTLWEVVCWLSRPPRAPSRFLGVLDGRSDQSRDLLLGRHDFIGMVWIPLGGHRWRVVCRVPNIAL